MNKSQREFPSLNIVGYICRDRNEFPDRVEESMGGAAYFSALGALENGVSPKVVARVGTDFPPETLPEGVRTEGIIVDSALPTTQVTLTYHDARDLSNRTLSVEKGASVHLSPQDIPVEWLSTAFIHVATMEPTQQLKFMNFLRHNAPTATLSMDSDSYFVDKPEFRETLKRAFLLADIVFMNKHEFDVFGFLAPAIATVICKQDARGAVALEFGQQRAHAAAPKVAVRSATGAGDFFAGSFLAQRSRGQTLSQSLEKAVNAASAFIS